MEKTGEAYTTARTMLLRRTPIVARVSAPAITPAIKEPINYEKLAGMSDAAIKKATGCTWEKWVWCLDQMGAPDMSHRAIAEQVQRSFKTSDWWSQMVTVGYERIKGLRQIGQRLSGAYEATKSKTIAAPAAKVFRAFNDSRARRKWLADTTVTIRKAVPGKSVRMTWDDGTSVEVWLTPKGDKTITAVAHRKLAGKEDVERRKQYWADRLNAISELTAS